MVRNAQKGTRDGQILRLKGQGGPGTGGAPPGDTYLDVTIKHHPFFKREGANIRVAFPISLSEAVLGAKVRVPTPAGVVSMTIPANANSGSILRLKGKGVPMRDGKPGGDQLVELIIMLPGEPDAELETLVRNWSEAHPYDARSGMEM